MNDLEKILILGDLHVPFQDDKALDCVIQYAKKTYKPTTIIMDADMLDFYSLSQFDKNPGRITNIQQDLNYINDFLYQLRKDFPKTNIYYLEGNHESRLKKYLWKHSELLQLDALQLENLLAFKQNKINYVGGDPDYWRKDSGHVKIADVIIMHGDNRLNGAKGGKYAAVNTMLSINHSLVMGHTHRLSLNLYDNGYVNHFAINTGCLCQLPSMADWQQGFGTFEILDGKGINPRVHQVKNGELYVDGKKYISKKKIQNPLKKLK